MNIAVLMTCHNRREKTLRCLKSLVDSCGRLEVEEGENCWDVFLVDDGSTDGTSEAVREYAKKVEVLGRGRQWWKIHLISGNGDLFWAKGMALAWREAFKFESEHLATTVNYDYFLWLNDDVILNEGALKIIFEDAKIGGVIVGACKDPNAGRISYGATDERDYKIVPNGAPQLARGWLNGNCVLIPHEVVGKVGIISDQYTHARADYDYAERLKRAGIPFYASSKLVGTCSDDFDEKMRGLTCAKRFRLLFRPGYWNLHDLWRFKSQYYGIVRACVSCLHLALIALWYRPRSTYDEVRSEQERAYRHHAYYCSGI